MSNEWREAEPKVVWVFFYKRLEYTNEFLFLETRYFPKIFPQQALDYFVDGCMGQEGGYHCYVVKGLHCVLMWQGLLLGFTDVYGSIRLFPQFSK